MGVVLFWWCKFPFPNQSANFSNCRFWIWYIQLGYSYLTSSSKLLPMLINCFYVNVFFFIVGKADRKSGDLQAILFSPLPPSLSLLLAHTHTHTHASRHTYTHIHTKEAVLLFENAQLFLVISRHSRCVWGCVTEAMFMCVRMCLPASSVVYKAQLIGMDS